MPQIQITIGLDDDGPPIHFEDEAAYILLVCSDIGLDGCPQDFADEKLTDRILEDVRSLLTRYEELT